MNLSKTYAVVIVGAGPAGSLLGYYLAKQQIPLLIVEKKRLPRMKVCGGGLTKRTLDILPFTIDAVVEDYATRATLSVKNHTVFSKNYEYPITALVMRDRFDHFLVQHAIDNGIDMMDDTEFIGVSGSPGNLTIETSRGSIKADIIVGADGAHSRVAYCLKLDVKKKQMTAIEAEIYLKQPNKSMDPFRHAIHFDIGPVRNGYGWVFPKKDHLSVGVLSLSNKSKGIRDALQAFIRAKKLDTQIETLSLRGHGIPYGPDRRNRYANHCGMVVGDATGIVDPITGEGIYYAARGAQIASEAVITCIVDNKRPFHILYDAMLKQDLLPEVVYARRLAHILYDCERLSHRALRKHGAKIVENHVNIITGRKTYRKLHKEVFSMAGLRTILAPKGHEMIK
jgi:geranylgeranyl reductase family protein